MDAPELPLPYSAEVAAAVVMADAFPEVE